MVKVLKAIANERRFSILQNLFKAKELSVGQISELIELSFKSTSGHLTVLTNADLVESRQVSLNKFYSIKYSSFPKKCISFFRS